MKKKNHRRHGENIVEEGDGDKHMWATLAKESSAVT